jgi:hypothetical protein
MILGFSARTLIVAEFAPATLDIHTAGATELIFDSFL